jgi:predicted transcriptional regulator of viral defense system
MRANQTDVLGLEGMALRQGGYFNRADALAHGVGDHLLYHYTRNGRFERALPGVYRMSRAPFSAHDGLLLGWVWSNYEGVISHESALQIYDLSDVMPSRIHLMVPLATRRSPRLFVLHRSTLDDGDVQTYEGMPVTTPARSIVDAAAAGTGPDQIELAVHQAVDRGLTTSAKLRAAADRRGYRNRRFVRPLIERALRNDSTAA